MEKSDKISPPLISQLDRKKTRGCFIAFGEKPAKGEITGIMNQ